jgi:hypothetical protein
LPNAQLWVSWVRGDIFASGVAAAEELAAELQRKALAFKPVVGREFLYLRRGGHHQARRPPAAQHVQDESLKGGALL